MRIQLAPALRAVLEARPGLAALVGDRIRPGRRSEEDGLPALVYQVTRDTPDEDLDGPDPGGCRTARVRLEVHSETLLEADAARAEAEAAFLEARGGGELGPELLCRWASVEDAGDDDGLDQDGSDRGFFTATTELEIRYQPAG